ncbi:MAG: hypothetical protein AB1512_13425 [Thermodesulfobacteriota bacterium]
MRGRKKGKVVTVRGLILPVEWDEHDNVVAVVIETADEESFIVETDKKGRELLQFIHHEVEATGTTREAEYGNVYIKVKTYTPLEKTPENLP